MNLETLRDRLRSLERDGKLDEVMPAAGDDDALPWSSWFEVNVWMAAIGAAAAIYEVATQSRPAGVSPAAPELVPIGVYVLLILACKVLAKVTVPRWQRRRRRLLRRGHLGPAAIVQANPAWYEEDNARWLPGSVVVTFDERARDDPAPLAAIAAQLGRLKKCDRRQLPPEEAWLAWSLYHEMVPLTSRAIPAALCGGLRDCWLATAILPPQPLRLGDHLLVLALPGDRSPDALAVLPDRLLGGTGT